MWLGHSVFRASSNRGDCGGRNDKPIRVASLASRRHGSTAGPFTLDGLPHHLGDRF
jgi:hypothetical protein